jgi:hypothetical protein
MVKAGLRVAAIRSSPEWIRPHGLHLRWMFPAELGFPPDGFRVYRRPAKRTQLQCADFRKIRKDVPLRTGSAVSGVKLHFHESVTLRGTGGSAVRVQSTPLSGSAEALLLRMEFDDRVVAVGVGYTDATADGAVVLRAFDEGGQVLGEATGASAPAAGGVRRLRIDAPSIASASLRLAFTELHEICTLTEARVCAEDWGGPVAELRLPEPPSQWDLHDLLRSRLGGEVRNHYVGDLDDAERRYARLPELLSWLHALVEGDPGRIANPGARPDLRTAKPTKAGGPLAAVHVQAMLLVAALDPNLAAVLSLGWADPFLDPPLDPQEGGTYDYKVTGHWEDRELCGLVLGLGSEEAPLPRMREAVTCSLLPGVRWTGTDPLRRVGVSWPRPPANMDAPVQPVLFQVTRRGSSPPSAGPTQFGPPADLTARRAVLVPADSWNRDEVPLFVDLAAPLGTLRYEVAGIDLFGQVSAPVARTIDVKDLAPPPPPVRVSAGVFQPGYPWLTAADRSHADEPAPLHVRFEYGAHQLRRAPDAASVSLYWRAGSLVDSEPVTVNVRRRERAEPDLHAYVVEVRGGPASDVTRFVGGVLVMSSEDGNVLPVVSRRRTRVVEHEGADLLRLAPSVLDLDEGSDYPCVLVTDPRNRDAWLRVHSTRVELQPPVAGDLVADTAAGRTMAVKVEAIEQPPPPAPLPTAGPDDVNLPIEGVEALVDRALLEPDLLEGDATGVDGPVAVLGSTAGLAYRDGTPGHRAATARLRLDLDGTAPPAPVGGLDLQVGLAVGVSYVEMAVGADPGALAIPGGELSFEVTRDTQPTLVVAQVVSDIRQAGNRLGFLVRFPESLAPADWPKAGDPVRYFRPYALEGLTVAHHATARSLRLAIPAGDGTATGYVALATTDIRGNVGTLSAPAQITLVRPPPRARPSAPFPCSDPAAADGFASPPDSDGRATLCLGWTYAPAPDDAAEIRFEVGRALDQTIVATDRRNWLIGRAAPGLAASPVVVTGVAAAGDLDVVRVTATFADLRLPDHAFADGLLWQAGVGFSLVGGLTRAGGTVTFDVERAGSAQPDVGDASLYSVPVPPPELLTLAAQLSSLSHDADRGLYRASATDPAGGSLASASVAAAINGGCLVQGDHRFQVTRARAEDDLVLLLRPVGNAQPMAAACTIEPPPDYSAVVGNVDKLRLLADKEHNEDAFGLATGVPIEATRFRDEIAGVGRNAFFYRARAVDPANNRSAWSPTSVPFWQVDTTPPAVPAAFKVTATDRAARLSWSRVDDPTVTHLRVYRRASAGPSNGAAPEAVHTDVGIRDLSPGRLTAIAGSLVLPGPVAVIVPGAEAVAEHLAARIVVHTLVGADPPNLFDHAASGVIFDASANEDGTVTACVTALTGLRPTPPDTPLRVVVGSVVVDADHSIQTWIDRGLQGGSSCDYRVAAVRTVRSSSGEADEHPRRLTIEGPRSGLHGIVAIDRSTPTPPMITTVRWVDPAGADVADPVPSASARLTIRATTNPARLLVERQAEGESVWISPPLDGARGWREWLAEETDLDLTDDTARPGRTWRYRAMVAMPDGRLSPPSVPHALVG